MTEIFAPQSPVERAPQASVADAPRVAVSASSRVAVPTVLERALGLVAVITLGFCAAALTGAHASDFVGITAAMMILCVVVGGLIMSHGASGIARLLAVSCGGSVRSRAESEQLQNICRRGRRLAYAAAFAMVIIGTMHVLSVLDMPSLIGPGIAVSLQAPFLAVIVGELLFGAAEHWCMQAVPPSSQG